MIQFVVYAFVLLTPSSAIEPYLNFPAQDMGPMTRNILRSPMTAELLDIEISEAKIDGKPYIPDARPFVPDQRPFVPDQRPFAPDQRPFAPDQRPFVPDQRPFVPDQRPFPTNGRQFVPDGRQFVPDGRQFVPDGRPFPGDQSPFPGDPMPFPGNNPGPFPGNVRSFMNNGGPPGSDGGQFGPSASTSGNSQRDIQALFSAKAGLLSVPAPPPSFDLSKMASVISNLFTTFQAVNTLKRVEQEMKGNLINSPQAVPQSQQRGGMTGPNGLQNMMALGAMEFFDFL